jgi:hypothetical protein
MCRRRCIDKIVCAVRTWALVSYIGIGLGDPYGAAIESCANSKSAVQCRRENGSSWGGQAGACRACLTQHARITDVR